MFAKILFDLNTSHY